MTGAYIQRGVGLIYKDRVLAARAESRVSRIFTAVSRFSERAAIRIPLGASAIFIRSGRGTNPLFPHIPFFYFWLLNKEEPFDHYRILLQGCGVVS